MLLALRALRRAPGFTAVVIVLLAVGLGANLLIFTFLNALLLRPLPVRDPDRLVQLMRLRPKNIPDTEYEHLQTSLLAERSKTLEAVFDEYPLPMTFEAEGMAPRGVNALMVSSNHSTVLGIRPALGRLLNPNDDRDPASAASVLSYSLWQSAFGGRKEVLGREIRLRGLKFTIVGVLPRGFNGMSLDEAIDVELPMGAAARWTARSNPSWMPSRIYGRMAPGVAVEKVRAEYGALAPGLLESVMAADPELKPEEAQAERDRARAHTPWAETAGGGVSSLRTQFALSLKVLTVAVGMLLLLVAANVGGLLLARGESRRREIAIRVSLGAGRAAVVRLVLAEALLLALAGLAGAVFLAWLATPMVLSGLPSNRPLAIDLSPDWRMAAFAVVACLLSTLAASLAPALRTLGIDLTGLMGRGGPRQRNSIAGRVFVGVQVLLATTLVIGGAMLVRTLHQLRDADLGFDRQHLLVAEFSAYAAGVRPDDGVAMVESVLDRARQIPSVESVSLASGRLMQGLGLKNTVSEAGRRIEPGDFLNTSTNRVTPEYMTTLKMRLVEGRFFTEADRHRVKPAPSIVTRSFARKFFGTERAVGRYFGSGLNQVAQAEFEVVGVVDDTRYRSMREEAPPVHYEILEPRDVQFSMQTILHLRVRGDPEPVLAQLRDILARTGPGLAAEHAATMEEEIDRSLWREQLIATLGTVFSVLAAFLAAVGLYGLLAQSIRRRTRELGIRIALGATPARILRLVSRDVVVSVVPGLVAGVVVYVIAARWMLPLLYAVNPYDPRLVGLGVGLLVLTAIAATLMPGRRAVKVQPAEALRDE